VHRIRLIAVADLHDLLPRLQKEIADLDALLETATRVAAHVENEGTRPGRPQLQHRPGHVLRRGVVEAHQRHVADAV
jgi:hypothetical protein